MWDQIIWNDEPGGNVLHIEQNGLSVDDVEYVLARPTSRAVSRSTGNPCVFGHTPEGTYIIVVYEEVDASIVYPITAYAVAERKRGR